MNDFPNCSGTCPCRCKTEPTLATPMVLVDQDPGDENDYKIPESGDKTWGGPPDFSRTEPPVTVEFFGEPEPLIKLPTRHPSSQAFHDRVDSYKEMHDRKQADYGSDTDPFANVRNGARKLGLPGWVGAVIRMNDKIERLNKAAKQFIETGEINLANEGVLDSFDDLAVYSGIGAVLFEEETS